MNKDIQLRGAIWDYHELANWIWKHNPKLYYFLTDLSRVSQIIYNTEAKVDIFTLANFRVDEDRFLYLHCDIPVVRKYLRSKYAFKERISFFLPWRLGC